MFNVFTGSSRLDAIISFCVREPRLALALRKNMHFFIVRHKGRFLRSYHIYNTKTG